MSCDINRGLSGLACKDAVAGIRSIYIANWSEYDIVTVSGTASGHVITDLGDLAEVFKYEVKNDGNSFAETIESDRNTGVTVFNQVLTAILTKITKQKSVQVKLLAWGRVIVFIEFNSGDFLTIGLENGCEVTGSTNVEGSMQGNNNYTLTFTGMERVPAFFLDDASVIALKALVSTDVIDA